MKVNNLFNLKGKVAVVTGGTHHIGLAMTEALLEAGAEVYLTSRDASKAKKTSTKLRSKLKRVNGLKLDISSNESINECFNDIVNHSKKIDILVNNASFNSEGKLEKIDDKSWETGIDGTINSVFRTTKAIIPIMKKNKSSSIINIGSIYGTVSPDPSIYKKTGFDSPPNYGAGKAAIIQFTRYTACHLAKYNIRVNCISPGPFPTKSVQKNKSFMSSLESKIPMKRIGQPLELKGIVVFLASNASSYLTGQNIHVDGGWTSW